jgi:hypothetical protein
MNMIDTILSRKEFEEKPPVLLDIGASGEIHPKWKRIAKYCIGIAFDADLREMNYVVKESSGYRKLYVINRIVTDRPSAEMEFYLTRSPYCSSLLKPAQESLNKWAFAELFEVDKIVKLKTTTLPPILQDIGCGKIDWFKTDSQGTDLRLFTSLGEEHVKKVLVAEFEPGIIDAYEGEDKLWRLLAYMDKSPFWMTSLNIKGTQRIERTIKKERLTGLDRIILDALIKSSPGYGEVSFFNMFEDDSAHLDKRDFLLGWVFAMIEEQYGFALELAIKGSNRYKDPVFKDLAANALKWMKRGYLKLPCIITTGLFCRAGRKSMFRRISKMFG